MSDTHEAALEWFRARADWDTEVGDHARALLSAAKEADRLRDALEDATAQLIAAASAYRKHAARSAALRPRAIADAFFSTRVRDFERAGELARVALLHSEGTKP